MSTFKSNPEYAAERSLLAEMLRALPIGGVLTFGAASEAIGRDVRGAARFSLMRAREMVEREDGTIRLDSVMKVGVKRLAEGEMHSIGISHRQRFKRATHRVYRRLGGAKVNDPAAAHQIRVQLALLGAVALALRERNVKAVDEAVTKAGAEVPAAVVLGLFVK